MFSERYLSVFVKIIFPLLIDLALSHPKDHFKRANRISPTRYNTTDFSSLRLPTANLTVPNVQCSGDLYRRDLEFPSCSDVLFQIPHDGRVLRFAKRGSSEEYDVPLPYRWISSDGICIIDLLKATAFPVGTASFNDLYNAAYWITHECVMGEEVGGLANNLGPNSNMALRMTSYRPLIRCYSDPGPPPDACKTIVDRMPASKEGGKLLFGKLGDPNVNVELPFKLIEPSHECQATITSPRELSDLATWYDMWEGITAVYGMCVRAGRAGFAFKQGTRGYLQIDIKKRESENTQISTS